MREYSWPYYHSPTADHLAQSQKPNWHCDASIYSESMRCQLSTQFRATSTIFLPQIKDSHIYNCFHTTAYQSECLPTVHECIYVQHMYCIHSFRQKNKNKKMRPIHHEYIVRIMSPLRYESDVQKIEMMKFVRTGSFLSDSEAILVRIACREELRTVARSFPPTF